MKQPEKMYFVVSVHGLQGSSKVFKKAEAIAKRCVEDGHCDVYILETVKAWGVEIPEEPQPEVFEADLSSIG